MFTVIIIIAIILCVVLVLAILIQNPKGGGLSGTFGGAANQIFGYKRATDDIEKITWGLVLSIIILCMSTMAFQPSANSTSQTQSIDEAKQPSTGQANPQQQQDNGAQPIQGQDQDSTN